MNILEETATRSNTDLTLTRYFVDKWSKGAKSYKKLAKEVQHRTKKGKK